MTPITKNIIKWNELNFMGKLLWTLGAIIIWFPLCVLFVNIIFTIISYLFWFYIMVRYCGADNITFLSIYSHIIPFTVVMVIMYYIDEIR